MTTNTQKKIGLVVEGGGMKCAYNAGILDAFLDEGITFDYSIWRGKEAGIFAFLQSTFIHRITLG